MLIRHISGRIVTFCRMGTGGLNKMAFLVNFELISGTCSSSPKEFLISSLASSSPWVFAVKKARDSDEITGEHIGELMATIIENNEFE